MQNVNQTFRHSSALIVNCQYGHHGSSNVMVNVISAVINCVYGDFGCQTADTAYPTGLLNTGINGIVDLRNNRCFQYSVSSRAQSIGRS